MVVVGRVCGVWHREKKRYYLHFIFYSWRVVDDVGRVCRVCGALLWRKKTLNVLIGIEKIYRYFVAIMS